MALLTGCQEKQEFVPVTKEAFADFSKGDYRVSENAVREELQLLLKRDSDRETADKRTRNYYFNHDSFLWITRSGVSSKADSVLKYIEKVGDFGFDRNKFCHDDLKADLQRVRKMDFESDGKSLSRTLARLEYHLTKAYLRYCTGQRFGFVNPSQIFNRLDVRDSDSLSVSYYGLFDIPMKKPGDGFYARAFAQIGRDSVGSFMQQSAPENPVYRALASKYDASLPRAERVRLLCNMERARWRLTDYPWRHDKFVLINIPTMHLEARDGADIISMRIGIGSMETKTPLLTSQIKRIDFNPQWIIPKSIVKKSIANHAGSADYFSRHNYFVMERATGKEVPAERVTTAMLLGKDYSVVQRGGKGNPLGSVIFRFDNNFSVFIHDTSSRDVFARENRSVSHGCIRVERPYDLALFMLSEKDDEMVQKIDYTMNLYAKEEVDEQPDKKLLLRSLKVTPAVPLFITYYTMYPDVSGVLHTYADIYGYDAVLFEQLKKYL